MNKGRERNRAALRSAAGHLDPMDRISPDEAGTLYDILLGHDALSLDPICRNSRELNLMLDKLRAALRMRWKQ